jgi:hypothetical protein
MAYSKANLKSSGDKASPCFYKERNKQTNMKNNSRELYSLVNDPS